MPSKRKQHTPAFKAQVALAAHKGDRTVSELAGQFGVHPTLIHGWKKLLHEQAESLFANGSKATAGDADAQKAELFEQIGRLKMELEWLKKSRKHRLNDGGCWKVGRLRMALFLHRPPSVLVEGCAVQKKCPGSGPREGSPV